MTRRYASPIDVSRRDDVPAAFRWRGRIYPVRAVLGHWVEAGGWWQTPAGGLDDGEREMWRVEAGSGVYDLCFDWSAGAWTLAHTHD